MKNLLYLSLAIAAMASCQKVSEIDSSITTKQAIKFAPYAGSSITKGTPVTDNDSFEANANRTENYAFEVSSFSTANSTTEKYFGFSTVTNTGDNTWTNSDEMFWPNKDATLHFGAYYPSSATFTNNSYSHDGTDHSLAFDYKVENDIDDQKDIMYAISDFDFNAPTAGTNDTPEANSPVNLHFKHALTQVAFTATKDDDIKVFVKSIKVCNVVDNGSFSATSATNKDISDNNINTDIPSANVTTSNFGSWDVDAAIAGTGTNQKHYAAAMDFKTVGNVTATEIEVASGSTATQLTSSSNVLMLIPQTLTAWKPEATNAGTESYLAIDCKITHDDGTAPIIDGVIYVPFDTKNIVYSPGVPENLWKAGYKITYKLNFGGGYTIPGPGPEPGPGTTPTPDDVIPTLRAITYSISVDDWMDVNAPNIDMGGTI